MGKEDEKHARNAAFFDVFINMNYLLAGAVSTKPILGLSGILLVLAWRIAGFLGVDHWHPLDGFSQQEKSRFGIALAKFRWR